MANPPISIVIPCYNQGHFIKDALESIQQCDAQLFEIIIVNDGSTDILTNQYLLELQTEGYHVIIQKNMGLGEARNSGINESKGKYILPLDADNRITPQYLTKGLEVFENDNEVAVVYGNANYFGDKTGVLKPGPFNLQRLMLSNYIDTCALIKKSAIEAVGLYDNMKIMGFEDWDLWLRLAFKEYKFHYIDEILFDYRVVSNSMMQSLNVNIQKQNEIKDYFLNRYPDKLDFEFVEDYFIYKFKKSPYQFLYQRMLKKYFPRHYNKLLLQHKLFKGMFYK
jgi:glycosyltransferase involved in cell wall biosynthesis